MRWLGLYFPELPLEVGLAGAPADGPAAVTETREGRERIARCNAAARARGVRVGQPLPAALALVPALHSRRRDPARERQALETLAQWAWQFSSRIVLEPAALLLEIGASLRLFGGQARLLRRVEAGLSALGHEARWAVAPTPVAAGLLARERPASEVDSRQALLPLLERIPLACLTRDVRARRLLQDIGLHSIGDALRLPRAELARRSGPELLGHLDRLLGDAPDPRPCWEPPAHFEQAQELAAEVERAEALLFPARRLLLALCGFLRGRGAATQRLEWRLLHRDGRPPTDFTLGLLTPGRDPEQLLARLRERLERLSLPAPVIGLGLRVEDCLPFAERTAELLPETPQGPDPAPLERLAVRLGEDRLSGLRARPDHRPERAGETCPPGEGGGEASLHGLLPPWLLHPPRPLAAPDGRPRHQGILQLLGRPRRIESGWWDGADQSRDYYLARDRDGSHLWIYRDRRSGDWFLHGLFE